MTVIETKNLAKQYGNARGVRNVNLNVQAGEVIGFLGPNGAGKTTTIRLLLDLIRPTSGAVFLFDQPVQRARVELRNEVGYLPGELRMYETMTGQQMLDYMGAFQRAKPPTRQRELLDALDLSPTDLKRPMRTYSQGMKRKIGITQAMQHDPRLLVLDEPSEGLDPLIQQNLYQLFRDYARRGGTIFMSSHILPEVEQVCNRIVIIRDGNIIAIEEVEALRQRHVRSLRVVTKTPLTATPLLAPGVTLREQTGTTTTFFVTGAADLPGLLHRLAQCDLVDLTFEHARLEDFFLQYYNHQEQNHV